MALTHDQQELVKLYLTTPDGTDGKAYLVNRSATKSLLETSV